MLKPVCDIKKCGKELTDFGGLVFSPVVHGLAIKKHLCARCYYKIFVNKLRAPIEASIPSMITCLDEHRVHTSHICQFENCIEAVGVDDCTVVSNPNGQMVISKKICSKHYHSFIAPLLDGFVVADRSAVIATMIYTP